jgi:UrcA family protein
MTIFHQPRRHDMNMYDSKRMKLRSTGMALLALGVIAAGTAMAATDSLEEVTVQGSRMTREVVGRAQGTGAPVELVTLTRHATYADLDLSTHSGASELRERVQSTAKAACRELDELFPLTAPTAANSQACLWQAVNGAQAQIQAAIDSAEAARAAR